MKDIEKILQRNSIEDVNIPSSVENKIQYALNHLENKSSKINYLKRIITAFISTILALLGSVTVYAALGGTIGGKPIFEYAKSGIKFTDQFEEYKQEINGQKLKHNETTVNLVSGIYDENYVLLEFDVKFSEEDKEYLRLGENMIEDEFIELAHSEIQKEWLREDKEKGIKNTINLKLNGDSKHIIIDNQKYYTGRLQTKTKISDNEYKVYQLHFINNEITGGKDEITLTFKDNSIENMGDVGKDVVVNSWNAPGNYKTFNFDGELNIKLSRNKIDENTKIIIPDSNISQYKNMIQKVEEIRITPLQIIVKVSIQIENVNGDNFTNLMNKEAKVYSDDGKELTAFTCDLTEKFIYKGKEISEGNLYDIEDNAKIEISEIIIIEKNDNLKGLKIVPNLTERIWTEENGFGNIDVTLNPMEVSLNQ